MKAQKILFKKKQRLKPRRGLPDDHNLTISSLLRFFLNKQGKIHSAVPFLRSGSHFNLRFA
jgi:hypothetical protein